MLIRCREKSNILQGNEAVSPWTRVSHFFPTTQTLIQFAEGLPPAPGDVVIYACGAFDLFHIGHLCFLEEARKLGDYLIVGIHTDQVYFLRFFSSVSSRLSTTSLLHSYPNNFLGG